jgi:hypothetical protein
MRQDGNEREDRQKSSKTAEKGRHKALETPPDIDPAVDVVRARV